MKRSTIQSLACAVFCATICVVASLPVLAQNTQNAGVVTKIDADSKQLTLKTDAGAELNITLAPKVAFRRMAPGEKEVRNGQVITFGDITVGDRALAVGKLNGSTVTAALIVVMSKADVAKTHAAEQAEWDKHSVIGIVTAASPEDIAIAVSGPGGTKKTLIITPAPNAEIRRYAPDSIQFTDAKPSSLGEIKTGDQVRALGDKSEDGTKLTAKEIVSGSFKEIAATIVSIDAASHTMLVTDLATKKRVTVKVNPDSNVRKLPLQMAQMLAARNRPPEEGAGRGRGDNAGGGAGAGAGRGRGFGGRGGGGGDLTQMLERVPAATLADLKPGDAIIVLSTVGASADQMTAITMLAGVEPILARPGGREMQLGGWSLGGLGGGEP
jgi:Cu/Ag efflux protein CusF